MPKGDLFEQRSGMHKSWAVDVAGLYVIASGGKYYKIGLASNMYRRLSSYHICWPQGFKFVNLALIDKWPKTNKDKQKAIRKKIREIEKRTHKILEASPNAKRIGLDASKSSEWFEVKNRGVITRAIQKSYLEWMTEHKKNRGDKTLHTNQTSIPTLITDVRNPIYENAR